MWFFFDDIPSAIRNELHNTCRVQLYARHSTNPILPRTTSDTKIFFLFLQIDLSIGNSSADNPGHFVSVGQRKFIIGHEYSWSLVSLHPCPLPLPRVSLSYDISMEAHSNFSCQKMTKYSVCKKRYSDTAMPNLNGMMDPKTIHNTVELTFQYIFRTECHQHLSYFWCLFLYPKCNSDQRGEVIPHQDVLFPCQEFCLDVNDACKGLFEIGGVLSVLTYKCSLLPKEKDGTCISETVNCGPPNATAEIGVWKPVDNSTTRGSTSRLMCPEGYETKAIQEITCQSSGMWTPSDAICIATEDRTNLYVGIALASLVAVLVLIAVPLAYWWRYEINVLLFTGCKGFRLRKHPETLDKKYDAFLSFNVEVSVNDVYCTCQRNVLQIPNSILRLFFHNYRTFNLSKTT